MEDLVNIAIVLGFDAAVLYFWGFKSLLYLLLGSLLGGGLHPLAGHLIAEHYMFVTVSLTTLRALLWICVVVALHILSLLVSSPSCVYLIVCTL